MLRYSRGALGDPQCVGKSNPHVGGASDQHHTLLQVPGLSSCLHVYVSETVGSLMEVADGVRCEILKLFCLREGVLLQAQ